jgi:hypothetical protein
MSVQCMHYCAGGVGCSSGLASGKMGVLVSDGKVAEVVMGSGVGGGGDAGYMNEDRVRWR